MTCSHPTEPQDGPIVGGDLALLRLISAQRPGWSLDQAFYFDRAVFDAEMRLWFPREWIVVGHTSELPERGGVLVRELFGESILITGGGGAPIRGFYNVCTHRGSRLCETDRRTRLIVCPYHAWSFALDGVLQSIGDLPEDVDPSGLGLRPLGIFVVEGVILCGLDSARLPDAQPAADALSGTMLHHGFTDARIVERRSYRTAANWKLVLENFFECYHCRSAHPEYFGANGHVATTALRDPQAAAAWEREVSDWADLSGFNPCAQGGGPDRMAFSVYRRPIGGGRLSLTPDGSLAGPVMGRIETPDGGETAFHFGRLSFASATNDFITLVQILPMGIEDTDVILTWLAAPEAKGVIDTAAVTWMWDVTTRQDKQLVEANAAGVRSRAYRPGPYTPLEIQSDQFVRRYLGELQSLLEAESGR